MTRDRFTGAVLVRMTRDRVTGAVLVLLGLAAALEASTFDVAFMTDPVGPKALPYLVAGMLVAAGVTAIARPRDAGAAPARPALLRIAAAVVAFVAYAVALPFVGFFASTTLVVAALALLYRGPPVASIASAALLSGALWLLFVRVLSFPLPVGDLWIR